ncbi:MAG: secretin N-terminal domain-containing protein [Vicinamibacterales bacterium]
MARLRLSGLVLLPCLLLLSGCATSGAMRAGARAEQQEDYDQAVADYTRALRSSPDDRNARRALERARLRASQEHFNRGRRFSAAGRLDESLIELELASELNPASGTVDDALREVRNQLRARVAVSREGKTELETLVERARTLQASEPTLGGDIRLPETLVFRNASSRDVYLALGQFAGITVVFDPQFADRPVTVDLRNASLNDALDAVSAAAQTFHRVAGTRILTVVPDSPAKRQEYEEEIVQTFYLSNADLRETIDLLRIVIDARRIAPIGATNGLTIKDTPDRVTAAARIISAVDKARPEVVIDVELLEVDRTRLREYGLQLASGDAPGISGTADVNRDDLTVRDLRNLTQSDIFLTNLPGLFYRLLKTDNNTRTLANPQLRTSEGISAQARFGERVPVPVTTFSPLASGGVVQQPITSFNYENIGVNIDITPRTHHDDEVSLALQIEVSSISGTGFNGLPTFGNRSINTVIRLRDGETNLLAGLIRDDERRVLEGVPGLSDLPILGRLFAHSRRETQETDIVLTLTPRIVRVLELSESDLRPFRVGRSGGDGAADLPVGGAPAAPAGLGQPRPGGAPDRIEPIRPPAPAPAPGGETP